MTTEVYRTTENYSRSRRIQRIENYRGHEDYRVL